MAAPSQYFCDCPARCKRRKAVSCTTFYDHAKYRVNLSTEYNTMLASHRITGAIPNPGSSPPDVPMDEGPSKRRRQDANHPVDQAQGEGQRAGGLGAEDPGLGAEDPGLGAEDPGLGAEDPGLGAEDPGLGAEDPGLGAEDQVLNFQ